MRTMTSNAIVRSTHRRDRWLKLLVVALGLVLAAVVYFEYPQTGGARAPNRAAQTDVNIVVSSANSVAPGSPVKSFRGLSLRRLGAYLPTLLLTDRRLTARDRTSIHRDVVSVDICADGTACLEIVAAARGRSHDCWYEREVLGRNPLSNGVRPGMRFAVTAGQSKCDANTAPRSGWMRAWPGLA